MYRAVSVILAFGLCLACNSKSPTQPTNSTPSGSGTSPSATPVARLQIKVDDGTPRDVLVSMSDVAVDASGSAGAGALTFSIDFGDGTVATSGSAHHTYATAGTFTIAATVTDAQGRKATDSSAITVKAVTGRWFQAGYVKRSNRVEVRQLSIDSQDGLNVRGIYRTTGDADRTFTGTLTPPRKIEIASSGGTGLLGLLPDRLSDEATPWTLIAQGADVDGERLDFHAIVGDPTGPPPVAKLKLSFGSEGVFGKPIMSLTPVQIDGTGSTGTGLTYFAEFGDGTSSSSAEATHTVECCGYGAVARVTVVDRFGRSASAESRYWAFSLEWAPEEAIWSNSIPSGMNLAMTFLTRNGVNYSGNAWANCFPATPSCAPFTAPMTAALSGVRDIRITVPALGATYQGTIGTDGTMTLVQSGGTQNGTTWRLRYSSAF